MNLFKGLISIVCVDWNRVPCKSITPIELVDDDYDVKISDDGSFAIKLEFILKKDYSFRCNSDEYVHAIIVYDDDKPMVCLGREYSFPFRASAGTFIDLNTSNILKQTS